VFCVLAGDCGVVDRAQKDGFIGLQSYRSGAIQGRYSYVGSYSIG
jgi:hypothetical protein